MLNYFDTEVAKDVGIDSAIIYKNIQYWCEKNRTNGVNFHDGLYWTFNSILAFCEQFPYMTKYQINNALNRLVENGYIRKGNYNQSTYDRTTWYADIRQCSKTENALFENQNSIVRKPKMEDSKTENGLFENKKPIPNINTNNKPNINTNNISSSEEEKNISEPYKSDVSVYDLRKAYLDILEKRGKERINGKRDSLSGDNTFTSCNQEEQPTNTV